MLFRSQIKKEEGGVTFTYMISELTGKRAEEGPKELCVVVRNTNTYSVKVSFSVAFFTDGAADEESEAVNLCIQPGKEMKGKKNGLCWLIDEANNKKIEDGSFEWDLNDVTVQKKVCD